MPALTWDIAHAKFANNLDASESDGNLADSQTVANRIDGLQIAAIF
jgi:hypothetical protein